jgi:hypothetical protein
MIIRFSLCLFLLTSGYSLAAQHAPPDRIDRWEFDGTIGTLRIQANLAIKGDADLVSGYYFSATHLEQIPLDIRSDGDTFVMTEPDGAIFRVHQQPMDNKHVGPLDFYNNNGLEGTWTDGKKTLPVRLSMNYGAPDDMAEEYSEVTEEPPTEFEARVRAFRDAALKGDKAGLAHTISYPLRVNGKTKTLIRTREQLYSRWAEIFTPRYLEEIKNSIPHEMFVHQGMASLGRGAAWFDSKGAAVLNLP